MNASPSTPEADATPNLRHLRAFAAAASAGSISAGAALVAMSQPAATQAVAAVERRAGVRLLDRGPTGAVPTEPGRLMAARIERGFAGLARAAADAGVRPHLALMANAAHWRALVAAVLNAGFRPGSTALGRNPSTVSRSCREIERLLRVPLFEKTSQGLSPTRQAEAMARAARLALAEFRQGFLDVRAWRGEVEGAFGIGCLPLAQAGLLPRALARFVEAYPRVSVAVVDGYYAALARALALGDVDMVVGALRGGDLPEGLVQEVLFRDPLAVVARPGHPLAGRAGLTHADVAAHAWIAPRAGAPARAYFERLMQALPPDPARPAPVETGAHPVMRGLLRATDRLTVVSLAQVQEDIEAGLLARLDLPLPGSERPIGVATRAGWVPGQPQRALLEVLRTVVAEG
jgi:DNA-binding transcriptional LysR family regulator